MYCEILGVHVAFGYMVAINLMQMRARLIDKRVGYLAASLFLHPQHELVTLCINSFRRDLQVRCTRSPCTVRSDARRARTPWR